MKHHSFKLAAVLAAAFMLTVLPSQKVPSLIQAADASSQQQIEQNVLALTRVIPVANTETTVEAKSLQEAAEQLMHSLAAQDGFEAWSQAKWTSYPLGPGTHGWIIMIQNNQQDIGYMVIHATASGAYVLTEYGHGAFPLFSEKTLYRSLVQLELISSDYTATRYYTDAFHAVWIVQSGLREWVIDAKTGEVLPISVSDLPKTAENSMEKVAASPGQAIDEADRIDDFHVYDRLPWVRQSPVSAVSYASLKGWIANNERAVAAVKLYEGRMLLPFAITGYHHWSQGEAYVQVAQDDARFIPLTVFASSASFYP